MLHQLKSEYTVSVKKERKSLSAILKIISPQTVLFREPNSGHDVQKLEQEEKSRKTIRKRGKEVTMQA